MKLVEWTLCVPTPSELEIWEKRMRMGERNALDPDVHKDETPEQFAGRVLRTQVLFSKYAVPGSDLQQQSVSPALGVIIRGLPASMQSVVTDELARHYSGEDFSTDVRIAVATDVAQSLFMDAASKRLHAPPTGGTARTDPGLDPDVQAEHPNDRVAAGSGRARGNRRHNADTQHDTPPQPTEASHDKGMGKKEHHAHHPAALSGHVAVPAVEPPSSAPSLSSEPAEAAAVMLTGFSGPSSRGQYGHGHGGGGARQSYQHQRHTPAPPRERPDRGEPQYRPRGACNLCDQEGHWAADCPYKSDFLAMIRQRNGSQTGHQAAGPLAAPAPSHAHGHGQSTAQASHEVSRPPAPVVRALATHVSDGSGGTSGSASQAGESRGVLPAAAAPAAAPAAQGTQSQRPPSVAMPTARPAWPPAHAAATVSFVTLGSGGSGQPLPIQPEPAPPPPPPASRAPVAVSAMAAQPGQPAAYRPVGLQDRLAEVRQLLDRMESLKGELTSWASSCSGDAAQPDPVGAVTGVTTYRGGKRFPQGFSGVPPALFEPAAGHTPKAAVPAAPAAGTPGPRDRPEPFQVSVDLPPPTLAESLDAIRANGKLRYFKPNAPPEESVRLVYEGTVIGRGWRVMLDDGANANLITRRTCKSAGIPILECDVSLTSCTAHDNPVMGITPPILVVYGVGHPDSIKVWHRFIVTDGMDSLYNVLLGNADTNTFGAVIDAGTGTYTLRTQFCTRNVTSPTLSLPTVLAPPAHREGA